MKKKTLAFRRLIHKRSKTVTSDSCKDTQQIKSGRLLNYSLTVAV